MIVMLIFCLNFSFKFSVKLKLGLKPKLSIKPILRPNFVVVWRSGNSVGRINEVTVH